MTGHSHGVYARCAYPGAPIEVGWWGEFGARFQFVSDNEALRLAAALTGFVHANMQAKARPAVMGCEVCAAREGELVSAPRLDGEGSGPLP